MWMDSRHVEEAVMSTFALSLRRRTQFLEFFNRRVFSEYLSQGFFENFITSCRNACDRGSRDHIGHDANSLGRLLVRVKDANAADQAMQAAGQGNPGHVAIGAGRGAANHQGVGGSLKRHRGVFRLAEADFIDEDDDLSGIIRGLGEEDYWLAKLELARICQAADGETRERSRLLHEMAAQREKRQFSWVVSNVDDPAPLLFAACAT